MRMCIFEMRGRTAGGVHGVDAHVGAADAHRALRREGARRVVLGNHQPMPEVTHLLTLVT